MSGHRVRLSPSPGWGAALLEVAESGLDKLYPDHALLASNRETEAAHRAVQRLRRSVRNSQLQQARQT